jgi:hypothetical protein
MVNSNEVNIDLENGECNVCELNTSKTLNKNKRGSCPIPFPCPCPLGLPCLLPLLLPVIIFGLGLLALIGYIIYVYGFNNGNWNPNVNSYSNDPLNFIANQANQFLSNRFNNVDQLSQLSPINSDIN